MLSVCQCGSGLTHSVVWSAVGRSHLPVTARSFHRDCPTAKAIAHRQPCRKRVLHKSAKKSTLWMFAAGKCSHEEQKWYVKVKLQEASHNHMISATRKSTTKITTQARDRGFGQLATSSQGLKKEYNPVLISSHSFRCAVLQVKY